MRVLLLLLVVLSIAPLYAQDLITEDKSSVVKLMVDSDPSDAEVYIDGKLYGRTPLAVKELSPGTYEVKIKKDSFNTFTQKTEIPPLGYKEVFSVLGGKYAILNMESFPAGAEVFLGDSLLGTAPLLKVYIPLGKHTILAKGRDFLDWSFQMDAAPTQYNLKAVMKSVYGYVTLARSPGGSQIIIDGSKVDPSELNNYKLKMGNHKIEVNNPAFSNKIEEDFLVGSETISSMKIESGYFSLNAFFKSLFVPGLGQYTDNAKIKGITIFSGTLISGLLWLSSGLSNSKKLKEYNDARTEYSKPGTAYNMSQLHGRLLSSYDAAKKSNKIKNITITAFFAAYAYNILDALIFHSAGQSLIVTQEKSAGNSFSIGFNMAL